MNFDVFELLYTLIATPILASVTAMNTALSGIVAPALRWALIAFVAGTMLRAMFKPGEPLGNLVTLLLGGAVALYMVSSSADYGTWARDVLLTGISREIPQAIAGTTGAREISASAFAEIWGKAWVAGVAVLRNLPWSVAAIGLIAVVVTFWLTAAVSTAIAFAVWLKAFVFLALLIGVGPLFGGLWIFPWTRGMFFGWLNSVLANIVLMILAVALLSLLVAAMTQLLAQIVGNARSGGNEFNQAGMLFAGIILFGVSGWLSWQLPGTAGAITHGFAGYARSGGMRLGAAVVPMIHRMGGGSRGHAAPASLPAPARAPVPPGQSLSNP